MYLSPEFALAFLVFFAVYWLLAKRLSWQNGALLVFSFLFYGAMDLTMAVYLAAFGGIVFLVAQAIRRTAGRARRFWLVLGLTSLALCLCTCKYYNGLRDVMAPLLPSLSGWQAQLLSLDILIPAGISFYTFQAVALLLACYRDAPVCRRLTLSETVLYLAFFPTVLAGPICRPERLLPRLRLRRRLVLPHYGLALIARGLVKKLVVAHSLATLWVDPMFSNPSAYNGVELALGAMAYALQIYADFSGLTDLVRGIAWLIGFRLPQNFNLPYLAESPRDFWRRWHISLSSWIRDYIYIPLGGSRYGAVRTQLHVMLAMIISGLWHGAGWNYVVWGALHGAGCVMANLWPKKLQPPQWLRIPLTFLFVTFAWIFFRATDLDQALAYLAALGKFHNTFSTNVVAGFWLLALYFAVQPLLVGRWHWPHAARWAWPAQWLALSALAYVCIEVGPSGVPAFIYFKF